MIASQHGYTHDAMHIFCTLLFSQRPWKRKIKKNYNDAPSILLDMNRHGIQFPFRAEHIRVQQLQSEAGSRKGGYDGEGCEKN